MKLQDWLELWVKKKKKRKEKISYLEWRGKYSWFFIPSKLSFVTMKISTEIQYCGQERVVRYVFVDLLLGTNFLKFPGNIAVKMSGLINRFLYTKTILFQMVS